MQLTGMIRTTCPPDQLMALLDDPAVLALMMPGGSEIRQTSATGYAFVIRKAIGPLKLNMPGTLTLTPVGAGPDRHMTAHAAHLIGGKVDIDLNIRLATLTGMTVLSYQGTMTATGLANRVLGEFEKRAQTGMRSVFLRLKQRAEGDQRAPAKPQGKAMAAKKA